MKFKFTDHDGHDIGWVRHLYDNQAENTIWLRCDTCKVSYEFVATTPSKECAFCGDDISPKHWINEDGVFCNYICAEEYGLLQAETKAYKEVDPPEDDGPIFIKGVVKFKVPQFPGDIEWIVPRENIKPSRVWTAEDYINNLFPEDTRVKKTYKKAGKITRPCRLINRWRNRKS